MRKKTNAPIKESFSNKRQKQNKRRWNVLDTQFSAAGSFCRRLTRQRRTINSLNVILISSFISHSSNSPSISSSVKLISSLWKQFFSSCGSIEPFPSSSIKRKKNDSSYNLQLFKWITWNTTTEQTRNW